MDAPRIIRVAAVQAAPVLLDLDATLDRLEQWTARARDHGATVVAFPETWLPGYPKWLDVSPNAGLWDHAGAKAVFARLFANAVERGGAAEARLGAIAARYGVSLVVGINERAGRSLYNAILTIDADGRVVNHHRKLVPTYTERLLWGYGDTRGLRTSVLDGARVGGLVCWEHWMPLARQALHDAGEEIHVAQWPALSEMNQIASRHYAFEGRCFVIAVGSILETSALPSELPAGAETPSRLALNGGSAIIGPNGRFLAGPVYDEETVLVADLDLAEIARESMSLDVSGHYSRPDQFRFGILPPPSES